jgi:hypothetical protein
VELEEEGLGIAIEVKYAEGGNLEKGCQRADIPTSIQHVPGKNSKIYQSQHPLLW